MSALPKIDQTLGNAKAFTVDHQLTVETGRVRRLWTWTEAGFATESVTEIGSGRQWRGEPVACDWRMPDDSEPDGAELTALSVKVGDDEGFTSEHLRVEAEIAYPAAKLVVKFVIWAYPSAPGIRTQLFVRLADGVDGLEPVYGYEGPADALFERIPIGAASLRRRYFGYHNDTQNRNDTFLDLLKEEVSTHPLRDREWCDWASVACLEDESGGVALVKESHKCVNQRGHATGGFVADQRLGLLCVGWGIHPHEIVPRDGDGFIPGWATWCLAWSGGDLERQVAFKTFDAIRFPIDPDRDVYVQANTWGSTDHGRAARLAAIETSVLEELEICADMGIDVLQIDDGWQVEPGYKTYTPDENGWRPHPECYPEGWKNVRDRASELGVKLGLWAAAMKISLEELKENHERGGFVQYKLDFAKLNSRSEIDELMAKVRGFIQWSNHQARVNWDVTENPARYGYFFAREYGSIYLENRKPSRPLSVVYRPHTVLRDLWQIAKYLNPHRFQCSIQNVDMVDRERSDAHLHSHSYAVAVGLVGIPLFFLQTRHYSKEAKVEIRSLLDVYKKHRKAMYGGLTIPVGDKPDNASWTGFQCRLPEENAGYLTVFRERCNPDSSHALKLGWATPGATIELTNLIDGAVGEIRVGDDGAVPFTIEDAPDFRLFKYRISG